LNWYRAIDRSWELMAPWNMAQVLPAALYGTGDKDVVVGFPGASDLIKGLFALVPNLVGYSLR
jgi:hypothetical protein